MFKRIMYALVILALLFSIISFSTPSAPAFAQGSRPEAGWNGFWQTSWTIMEYGSFKTYRFDMTLTQSGSTVTGTSNYYGWKLNGTVSGNTLTGTWSAFNLPAIWDPVTNTYISAPHKSGQLYFTLDPSGGTFTGLFKGEFHWVTDISDPATWDQRFVVNGEKYGYTPSPAPSPTPPPPPPPPPTPTPTPPSISKQFTGNWDTEYGEMNLLQVGNTLTGTYDDGAGKIEGTVDGNTATGTWSEAPSYQPPEKAGDFLFILSADGKIISGKWRFGSCDWDGDIRGTRGEQPTPPPPPPPPPPTGDWSGTWSTNWRQMTLSQSGNQVTGSYAHDNGRISATVSGNTLRGIWSEAPSYAPPDDAGEMVFTMSADGQSFTGDWRYGSTGDWKKNGWQGTRLSTPKTITVTSTCDWSGTWDFDWSSALKLAQTGNHVTGTYIPGGWNYTATIDGTVSGNAFEGTWTEQDRTGRMQLNISADCNSFTGRYTHSLSTSSSWSPLHAPGVKVTSPQPTDVTNLDWSGTWNTDWGEMQLSQDSEQVTGTYEYNDGEIEGNASGNILTGTWSKSPSYAEPNDLGSFEFTMSADQMSFTGNWRYASCDWNGDWDSDLIEPDVTLDNRPPVASFYVTPQSPTTSDIVIANSTSTDPDGDALTYSWSLDGTTAHQYTVPYIIWQNLTVGTHTIGLLVDDGKGGTGSYQAQVTVSQAPQPQPYPPGPTPGPNQVPIASFSITPQAPTTSDTIIASSTSTDPDGDSLTYSWFRDGIQVNECNNMPYCTWVNPTAGIHTIGIIVSDGKGGTAPLQTQVTVSQSPQPQPGPGPIPGANNPPKAYFVIEPPQPEAGDNIKIVSQSTDADGDKLGFAWYLDGQILDEYTDSASWKWKKPQTGGHVMRLLVDDSKGGEDAYSKKIKITGEDTDDSGGGFPKIEITLPQCFIATAAYGSPTAEELDTLRAFRDQVLLQSEAGTALVELYYQISPPAATYIASHEGLRTVVREVFLDPAVTVLKQTQSYWNTDTEKE